MHTFIVQTLPPRTIQYRRISLSSSSFIQIQILRLFWIHNFDYFYSTIRLVGWLVGWLVAYLLYSRLSLKKNFYFSEFRIQEPFFALTHTHTQSMILLLYASELDDDDDDNIIIVIINENWWLKKIFFFSKSIFFSILHFENDSILFDEN